MGVTLWWIPVVGYLLGTILPADYIVRARRGASPPEFGENYGTAATWRLVGPGPALLVFAWDFLKGAVTVYLALHYAAPPAVLVLAAMAPVLGHNWPVQRRFRGGRGLAATIGTLVVLAPQAYVPAILAGVSVALYKRRTPWVGYVGLPLGLVLGLWLHLPAAHLLASFAVSLLLLLRQLQWGNWS